MQAQNMASEYGRTVWEARAKDSNNGHEELLVFGYSCKLFRDNEKAQYVEKGEHLIPWMGDRSLMVDRYDVRGALYDLTEAESGGGGDRWEGLTKEERAEEEKCDYERYLALYHDEFQYQEYQDEETKRLMTELSSDTYTYSQVGFSYDGQVVLDGSAGLTEEQMMEQQGSLQQQAELQQQQMQQQQQQEQYASYFPDADEDTFVPPPDLNVPPGMVVPETVKQNKIIVKTSKFIVTQGGQMEIVIKTKQAGNSMFSFLSFDNPLNAYYKHMVSMIKSGRYRPSEESELAKTRKDSEGSEGQYLHPSLSAGIKPDLAPGTPTVPHKPAADCAYSKLIHKIKEKQKGTVVVEGKDSPAPAVMATSTPKSAASAEVVDSLKKKKVHTDITPVGSPKITSLVDYPSFNQTAEHNSDDEVEYSGRSKDERCLTHEMDCHDLEYSSIKWPPPEVQMVIDKMASYIIKNGSDFEAMVRSRNDPRFDFMKKDHEFYPYYRCKIRLYTEVYGDIFKEGGEDKSKSGSNEGGSGSCKKEKRGSSKQPSTISFSIKSREQEVNLDRHSTFPVESSSTDDEDMEEEERERRRVEREERRRKRKIKEKEERERREREERERKEREEKEKFTEKAEESSDVSDDNEDVYDIFKYAQEMGNNADLEEQTRTSKSSDDREKKDADTSTSVMHEDTPPFCQPERKQQERRKKAAMFLSRLKKGSGEDEASGQPTYGPQLPPEIAAQILNSASQSPRSSHTSPRRSTPSRSRSHSVSPGPGIPMPPREAPAPPPPPPPALSPVHSGNADSLDAFVYKSGSSEAASSSLYKNDRNSLLESCPGTGTGYVDHIKSSGLQESSVVSGASEDGRRSQSVEMRRSKSRQIEMPHREKTRSRKKQRRGRSESRSPSSRRDRKKRKRSRSRSHRHKKRRSRSRSHSKTHSRSSHKKKRRKHSTRHDRERGESRSKKSRRRSISSSSSYSSEFSYSSSRSSSESEDEVQVLDSPGHSKRGSRASSEVSVGASDMSLLSAFAKIPEESMSGKSTPLPSSQSSNLRLTSIAEEKMALEDEGAMDTAGNGSAASSGEGETKEEKKEEKKPLFNPQSSAAMAKIAMGLRAKVHALLEKESKL